DDGQAFFEKIFTNHNRRQEAQHVAVSSCGQGNDTLFASSNSNIVDQSGKWSLGFWVDEFHGHHRTATADVADAGIVLLDRSEVLGNDFFDAQGFGCEVFVFHDGNRSQTSGDGNRVSTVSATQAAGVDHV